VGAKVITRGHRKSTDRGDEEKNTIELTTGKLAIHRAHQSMLLPNVKALPRPWLARHVLQHGA
jgi:hypothetical protein